MIEVSVRKRIKTYNGFDHIKMETSFHANHITQITGPSGSGKTTLLKIIAGLTAPEEGKVTVGGEVWLDTRAGINLAPQKRRLGMVFQDYALFPNMTVLEHLNYGTTNGEYIQRLISTGRLESFTSHKPKHLSGGQQQRLGILRALATKPRLLLMDEPFSALNSSLAAAMMHDLKELFSELEITCLVVTHQNLEPATFADYTFSMGGNEW